MKHALGTLIRLSGLEAALRHALARRRVSIVVYHDPAPHILRQHLGWFAQRYRFTTLDAVADALDTGRWERLPSYPLVVTFDDGHRGNLRLAPVLEAFGVRPTVYLCSQVVGTRRPYWWMTDAARRLGPESLKTLPDTDRRRALADAGADPAREGAQAQAMEWDEVRRLTALADFGAHTRTHPILPRCDDRRSEEEIAGSKAEVEAALGRPCAHFAYPNGDFGEREVRALRRAGFRTARTIDPGRNGPDTDPMRLKAFAVPDDASVGWLAAQMTGIPAGLRRLLARTRGAGAPVASTPRLRAG